MRKHRVESPSVYGEPGSDPLRTQGYQPVASEHIQRAAGHHEACLTSGGPPSNDKAADKRAVRNSKDIDGTGRVVKDVEDMIGNHHARGSADIGTPEKPAIARVQGDHAGMIAV